MVRWGRGHQLHFHLPRSWPSAAFSSSQVTILSSSVFDPWSSGAYPRSIGCYTPGVAYSVPRYMSAAGILPTGTNGSPVNALAARNGLVETDVFPSIGQYDTTEHALPANAALASSSGLYPLNSSTGGSTF